MLGTPQVIEAADRPFASLRLTVPRSEIRAVMGPGLAEVRAALAAQGIAPAGPWFTHHLRMPSETFDFEIGIPVDEPVAATGRVKPGRLPASRVARAVHSGPFEGLGAAWGELNAWIAANGHEPGPDLWESYVEGPESSPDPSTWRTELNRPLLR